MADPIIPNPLIPPPPSDPATLPVSVSTQAVEQVPFEEVKEKFVKKNLTEAIFINGVKYGPGVDYVPANSSLWIGKTKEE